MQSGPVVNNILHCSQGLILQDFKHIKLTRYLIGWSKYFSQLKVVLSSPYRISQKMQTGNIWEQA